MQPQANQFSRLLPVIVAVAVVLLLVSGLAVAMARMSVAADREEIVTAGLTPSAGLDDDAGVGLTCPECGVVSSTRLIKGVEPGANGQGEAHGKIADRYEVTVRMRDGSSRVFTDSSATNWRPGERMTLIESAIRSKD